VESRTLETIIATDQPHAEIDSMRWWHAMPMGLEWNERDHERDANGRGAECVRDGGGLPTDVLP
jgi:hypothetical protein